MKTISLDHPVRVYFKDGECYHDSAAIMIANGFPSFVRGRGPDVVYPWENVKRIARVASETHAQEKIAALEAEIVRLTRSHREKRLALHKALGLSDNEELDHAALCERVAVITSDAGRLAKSMAADLASVTEQRDVLKRQLEELRAETRKPALSQPKEVEPGGPIWVRVVDTTSKHFGLVGVINGIEYSSRDGCEMWSVDLGHTGVSHQDASMFAVVGTGRKPLQAADYGTGVLLNPTDEPNPDNRDSYRSTALRAGAKDCTLFVGPKPTDLTFVVEMHMGYNVSGIVSALEREHGLRSGAYRIREVLTPGS